MATTTYVPIETKTLASATNTVTFSSIPQTYTDLVLMIVSKWTGSGNSSFGMRFNSDSASNYSITRLYGDGSSATSSRNANIANTQSGQINSTNFSPNVFHIMNYSNNTTNKTVLARIDNTGSLTGAFVSLWRSTAAITQIDLGYFDGNTGNFASGSTFTLYGIANADTGAKATGGIITYDSTYYYHTFGASGTFTPSQNLTNVDYLVIAGGGGGGDNGGGGGGAGGLRSTVDVTGGGGSLESKISLNNGTAYTITVGAGGAGGATTNARGVSGGNSSISGSGLTTITSTGGGGGCSAALNSGLSGGSGGGSFDTSIASGTAGQGYAGGNSNNDAGAGAGGGAGSVGGNAVASTRGGIGGSAVSIPNMANATGTGVATYYAGGGGGGGYVSGGVGGAGGGGGATAGATRPNSASNATSNTGSGGGGGAWVLDSTGIGGNGGSGIVIIRYAK